MLVVGKCWPLANPLAVLPFEGSAGLTLVLFQASARSSGELSILQPVARNVALEVSESNECSRDLRCRVMAVSRASQSTP